MAEHEKRLSRSGGRTSQHGFSEFCARGRRTELNIEELVEILIAYNYIVGNLNLVALLKGEKTINEYMRQAQEGGEEHLKMLEEEAEHAHELLKSHLKISIEDMKKRQERIEEYLAEKGG